MPVIAQPAIKSYFFGRAYSDLFNTIKDGWQANLESVKKLFGRAREFFGKDAWHWFAGIFFGSAGVSVIVFGSIVYLVTSAIHILVLGSFFIGVYSLFSIFYLVERVVMFAHRIFVTCPGCHKKWDLPGYKCPQCGTLHSRLIPGPYGIFLRRCECGKSLRTSFLTGRTAYEAICLGCAHQLEHAETAPVCIPIIGTPGSGKTCFLYSFVEKVLNVLAPSRSWTVSAADERTQLDFDRISSLVSQGLYPKQTTDKHAQAFKFTIRTSSGIPKVLHLYDSAGEAFLSDGALDTHRFYGYCHGIAAIIDSALMLDLHGGKRSSAGDPEDAFVRMLNTFEKMHQLGSDRKIDCPLAVILNKIDDPRLGPDFAFDANNPGNPASERCREFLKRTGAHNLLTIIGQRYTNVRYFGVSALTLEHGRLVSHGMEPVCRWILSQSHGALRSLAIPTDSPVGAPVIT